MADAIVRVFIDHGDRTDRKKARLKYVLDAWGLDKFLAEVEAKLGRPLVRLSAEQVSAPNRQDRQAHVGVHPAEPARQGVGRRRAAGRQDDLRADARPRQDRARAGRRRYPPHRLAEPADLRHRARTTPRSSNSASPRSASPRRPPASAPASIACTGNTGCKFALSNTKGTAMAIADWVEPRVALDTPHQHPPDRLPALLRPALHRRHRPAGLPRARRCGRRGHGRGLPRATSAAASAPTPASPASSTAT